MTNAEWGMRNVEDRDSAMMNGSTFRIPISAFRTDPAVKHG